MIWIQLLIVLLFIFLGARIGGIGIGLAGGAGLIVLSTIPGVTLGSIPVDVILIIMSVITAISAMQIAGGMDWLVDIAEKFLRKNPKQITIFAPIVTYLMTFFAGTGHTAFSTLPVIAEVAKEQGIKPSKPLSIAVVASQIAITASPISAAVVAFAAMLEPQGVGYLQLLAIAIPTTLLACIVTAIIINVIGNKSLDDDPVYQARLKKGLVTLQGSEKRIIKPKAKLSVSIFLISIVAIVTYATLISNKVGLIENPTIGRNHAIMAIMLLAATLIVILTKIDTDQIPNTSTFKSGMSACICVLGVAWLGNTFVTSNIDSIKDVSANLLNSKPWLLAVTLFFASMLLYSQASTTKALMPFVLPTYPTLLAAVEMDDTGTTRIGKWVFNHSFFIPGVIAITLSVIFGFVFGGIIL